MATGKRGNGTGKGITINDLSPDDPQQARALAMSQMLAEHHGRRRGVIIALLDAMYQHYERTGELMSGAEVYARILGGSVPTTPAPAPRQPAPAPRPEKASARRSAKAEKARATSRAEELAAATAASGAGWFD